jgi:hypothetical protein
MGNSEPPDYAFYQRANLTSVIIPASVNSIGDYAFSSCTSLTNITIGNSVTSIGEGAFGGCTNLGNVMIPGSVTNIAFGAFVACTSLTTIAVDVANPYYGGQDGILFNKSQTTLLEFPGGKAGSYVVPSAVTNIGYGAFYSCINLVSVIIPDSVTSIDDLAFAYCSGLTNATIGRGVRGIGIGAFSCCTGLAGFVIGNGVTNIGDGAFNSCTSLTGVYFTGDAPNVGLSAFYGDNIGTVYYLPGTKGWGPTFGDLPTVLWNPLVQTSGASFGVRANRFGFNITGSSNLVIVAVACTDLANPIWTPVRTNTLTNGSAYFSDPQWTNFPTRLYRLRSP